MKDILRDEIITLQEEYIDFLGEALSKNCAFLAVHDIYSTDEEVEQGIRMRAEIQKLKEKLIKTKES